MKKISFLGSAALGVVSIFMFSCLEVIEETFENFLHAYMTVSAVNYSSDMFQLDFSNLKIILFAMAIVFFALAVASLFFGGEKK